MPRRAGRGWGVGGEVGEERALEGASQHVVARAARRGPRPGAKRRRGELLTARSVRGGRGGAGRAGRGEWRVCAVSVCRPPGAGGRRDRRKRGGNRRSRRNPTPGRRRARARGPRRPPPSPSLGCVSRNSSLSAIPAAAGARGRIWRSAFRKCKANSGGGAAPAPAARLPGPPGPPGRGASGWGVPRSCISWPAGGRAAAARRRGVVVGRRRRLASKRAAARPPPQHGRSGHFKRLAPSPAGCKASLSQAAGGCVFVTRSKRKAWAGHFCIARRRRRALPCRALPAAPARAHHHPSAPLTHALCAPGCTAPSSRSIHTLTAVLRA